VRVRSYSQLTGTLRRFAASLTVSHVMTVRRESRLSLHEGWAHGRRSSYTSDDEAPRGQDDCHFERARRIDRSTAQMRIESGNHDSLRPKRMPAVNQAPPRSAQSTARLLQSATLVFRVAVRALAPSRADRQVLGSEASPRYPAESKAVRLSLAIVVQVSNRLSIRPPIQGSRGAHKSESR
jgi:hypothetical protein